MARLAEGAPFSLPGSPWLWPMACGDQYGWLESEGTHDCPPRALGRWQQRLLDGCRYDARNRESDRGLANASRSSIHGRTDIEEV